MSAINNVFDSGRSEAVRRYDAETERQARELVEKAAAAYTPATRMEIPDVAAYVERRWPTDRGESDGFMQVAKVAEEAGEAVGAAIKAREGRQTKDSVDAELADVILAAFCALQFRGANVARTVEQRWAEVSQR